MQQLQRVLIWPPGLRLSHWILALSTSGLWLSGWLFNRAASVFPAALDVHFIFAWLLLIALALRLWHLVGSAQRVGNWRSLLPVRREWPHMRATLRCYFSFGKSPLPRWHAHNPLWRPVYALLWLAILLQCLTGFIVASGYYHAAGLRLLPLHGVLAEVIITICLLHISSVIVHDLKGGNSDISAMIHGYRLFILDKSPLNSLSREVRFEPMKPRKEKKE